MRRARGEPHQHRRYRFLTEADIEAAEKAREGMTTNAVDRNGEPLEGSVYCGACAHALSKNSIAQIAYCASRRFQVGTARPKLCDRYEEKKK